MRCMRWVESIDGTCEGLRLLTAGRRLLLRRTHEVAGTLAGQHEGAAAVQPLQRGGWPFLPGLVGVFLLLFAFASWTGRGSANAALAIQIALAAAGTLASMLYLIRWLSPRKVSSGPTGIVIEKADQLTLIPWVAIENFSFSHRLSPPSLILTLRSGEVFSVTLSDKVQRSEIEREILQNAGQSARGEVRVGV